MNNIARYLVIAALAVTAGACGSSGGSPAAKATGGAEAKGDKSTIEVRNIAYKPGNLKVLRSTTVTWTNRDGDVRHTVTSGKPGNKGVPGVSKGKPSRPDGTFDGDLPNAGAEFSFTFKKAGTYRYFCEIHPSMVASVIVE